MKAGHRMGWAFLWLIWAFGISACVTLDLPVTARTGQGSERTVEMQASSYFFEPNNIVALEGDRIEFTITNTADKAHNFTLVDPRGSPVRTVELPPDWPVFVSVILDMPGKYRFYCDKPFHAMLGMEGQISVVPFRY
jgi:plastocyanin